MPSSATITSFYTFAANTKARANYVNTNFSNYRGHIIAIDPNTATAATTETYDLGSTEYRWRTGYFREVDLKSNTSTGQALQIVGDTAAGNGAFLIKVGSNTRARLGNGSQYFDGDTNTTYDFRVNGTSAAKFGSGNGSLNIDTTTSQFDFKIAGLTVGSLNSSKWIFNINTTTGQFDFILNGSTLGSIKVNGFERNLIKPSTFYEANKVSETINYATVGSTLFQIGTLSITSNGHTFLVGCNLKSDTGYINIENTTTGTGFSKIFIYRDGTSASNLISSIINYMAAKDTSTSNTYISTIKPWAIDSSCSSGGHTYYFYGLISTGRFYASTNTTCQAIELI